MKLIYSLALAAILGVGSVAAMAKDYKLGKLNIEKPWARMTIKDRPAAGYMKVHNMGDEADRIVSASSPMANKVELHTQTMDNGVMRMRMVEHIEVPAKSHVELKSGGLHLMIFGIKHHMKPGDKLPISVTFEKAGKVDMEFMLQSMTGKKMEHGEHSGHSSSTQ